MALNTLKYNQLTPLPFKELNLSVWQAPKLPSDCPLNSSWDYADKQMQYISRVGWILDAAYLNPASGRKRIHTFLFLFDFGFRCRRHRSERRQSSFTTGTLLREKLFQFMDHFNQLRSGGPRDHQVQSVPRQITVHEHQHRPTWCQTTSTALIRVAIAHQHAHTTDLHSTHVNSGTQFDCIIIITICQCCFCLTPSTPAVPNCCCSKGSVPYWSNPPFLIFEIWALWRSGLSARAPECQKLKMVH